MEENQQNLEENQGHEIIIDDNNEGKRLNNAVATLVLGIIAIPACFCYGIIAIILGIVTLAISNKEWKAYKRNPGAYKTADANNMKAGRICGIIGLCLGGLYFLFIIGYLLIVGTFYGSILSAM